jgi:hypothetical protein
MGIMRGIGLLVTTAQVCEVRASVGAVPQVSVRNRTVKGLLRRVRTMLNWRCNLESRGKGPLR